MDYLHLPDADGDTISNDGVSDAIIRVDFESGESPPTDHLPSPADFEDAASTSLLLLASESPSPVAETEPPNEEEPVMEAASPQEESFDMAPEVSEEVTEAAGVMKVDAEAQSDSSSSNQSPEASSAHLLHHDVVFPQRCQLADKPMSSDSESMTPFLKHLDSPPPFLYWNWPLIRRLFWGSGLTGLLALLGVCIAMLLSLPRHCDPPTAWWQGSLSYEVFPASFKDSNGDGVGDLQGLESHLDYIHGLGARSIRLNGLFRSTHFPEHYRAAQSLLEVAPELGSVGAVAHLAEAAHLNNLSLLLDLPVEPLLRSTESSASNSTFVEAGGYPEQPSVPNWCLDMTGVLQFWLKQGVDGFYLKDLELVAHEPELGTCFGKWRQEVDAWGHPNAPRVLMASVGLLKRLDGNRKQQQKVAQNLDMVDAFLALGPNVTRSFPGQLVSILEAPWAVSATSPWINWNLGSATTPRLGSRLGGRANASLAAQMVLLSLPGTATLFYGDELGTLDNELADAPTAVEDESDDELEGDAQLASLAPLAPLAWDASRGAGFSTPGALPWTPLSPRHQTRNVRVLSHSTLRTLTEAAAFRESTVALHMNGDYDSAGRKSSNFLVRHADDAVVLLERWYSRRPRLAVVANLDSFSAHKRSFTSASSDDIGVGGDVVLGTHRSPGDRMDFSHVHLAPGEAAILRLYS